MYDHKEACINVFHASGSIATLEHIAKYNGEIEFKVCNSVHHRSIQINQTTICNNFSSLLLDVYVQLNMLRASSRPSSGAYQLQ
jgi:hypothetical protein